MLVTATTYSNHHIREKKLRQINWSFVPLLSTIVPKKFANLEFFVKNVAKFVYNIVIFAYNVVIKLCNIYRVPIS